MPAGRVPATGEIVSSAGPSGGNVKGKVLYVNQVPSDGWLKCRDAISNAAVYLLKYTRVQLTERRQGRTFFEVMDGGAKGRTLSLSDENSLVYLGPKAPTIGPAKVVVTYGKYVEGWVSRPRGESLNHQLATLEVAGITAQVSMNSEWGRNYTPMPAGQYTVLLPVAPHDKVATSFYRPFEPRLKFDQVWFQIQYGDNSRFVHVGHLSHGCTTVLDLARWADIHEALISHRSADGKSVAQLTVKGTPEKAK